MALFFAKYHGAGNDFVIVDDRALFFDPSWVPFLCHRRLGIGCDGVIAVRSALLPGADCAMVYFNADGSRAALCGNGLRCCVAFIATHLFSRSLYRIETDSGALLCSLDGRLIETEMPLPSSFRRGVELVLSSGVVVCDCVDVGVPHAILFSEKLPDGCDFVQMGASLRSHPAFAPHGTNVTWALPIAERRMALRTYERGVEGETLACGTGAVAAAFAAAERFGWRWPIEVIPLSGDFLEVRQTPSGVFSLKGEATLVFEGTMALPVAQPRTLFQRDPMFSTTTPQ